jgi:formate C-acetyltransferase
MEFVMTNGWSRIYDRKMGLETGDPRKFKSFEEVQEAYRRQVDWFLSNRTKVSNIGEQIVAELAPTVYESALIEDCIERGICREEGGARYNQAGIQSLGSSDVADSLAAIKKLVFEDKRITMDQLCDALDHNFEGYEDLRQMLLKAPKFGNDDDYADEQKVFASHVFASETVKHKNTRGGCTTPYAGDMASYVPFGKVVGALPSGRLATEPLGDAFSPCAGCDMEGPTAVLKSMAKIDHVEYFGGTILNLRMEPAVFEKEDGVKRLTDFIRAFVDQRIFHMQINIVSSDTLRAAQEEPEKYRDLLVKVAGYSAYFLELSRPLQNGIIARTEHGL